MIVASPIGPAPTIDDRVARLHASVEDPDLVGRGQDVGEEEHLLVRQARRDLVDGRVGERHAGVLGLEPVDQVAEDPAASARAEPVVALSAEAAAPARGDAGDEHAVALRERRDRVALGDDGADGLVAEDRARRDLGDVPLEDVQVGTADGRGIDADHDVRRVRDRRIGDASQRRSPGP